MKKIKNNKAVSHVVGFVLVFSITSILVASFIFTASTMIDQRTRFAVERLADGLADRVSDAIMEAVAVKQNYPYLNYSRNLDIPEDLAGKSYYIESTEEKIYVNTTDGQVSVNNTNYNLEAINMGISGKVYSSSGNLKIYCNSSDYVYRFDFGSEDSSSYGEYGYTRVSDTTLPSDWDFGSADLSKWKCRTPIYINNPFDFDLIETQVKITLNPFYFDYSQVNRDASDILFTEPTRIEIPDCNPFNPYWIEKWNYYGESVIWVRVMFMPASGSTKIYLYHNCKEQNAIAEINHAHSYTVSNGEATFEFFDDFNNGFDEDKWEKYSPTGTIITNGVLNISNKNALTSTYHLDSDEHYVIEAKASSMSGSATETQSDLEADIFARSTDDTDPFDVGKSYIFTNGNFTNPDLNAAIIKIEESKPNVLVNATGHLPLDNNWKRLTFRINDSWLRCRRYNYLTNYWEIFIGYIGSVINEDSYFGLCNTNSGGVIYDDDGEAVGTGSGAYAYYDWVFLRKGNTSNDIDIGATQSIDYYWSGPVASLERGPPDYLRGDFVYNETELSMHGGSIIFTVKNLQPGDYSVSVIIGDIYNSTSGIDIYANNDLKLSGLSSASGEFIEKWFNVTLKPFVTPDNRLIIKFSCNSGHILPVCALTIEKGIKGVKIGNG